VARGFSPGAPVSPHMQGKLTGWVRINTKKEEINIIIVVKIV
jgi:hypothetical protein